LAKEQQAGESRDSWVEPEQDAVGPHANAPQRAELQPVGNGDAECETVKAVGVLDDASRDQDRGGDAGRRAEREANAGKRPASGPAGEQDDANARWTPLRLCACGPLRSPAEATGLAKTRRWTTTPSATRPERLVRTQ
jgi:hypothetical protein